MTQDEKWEQEKEKWLNWLETLSPEVLNHILAIMKLIQMDALAKEAADQSDFSDPETAAET